MPSGECLQPCRVEGGTLTASIGTRSVDSNGGSWRIVIALGWVWAIILGVGILFMPESPRWLMAHEKYDEARLAIAKVSPFRSFHAAA